MSDLESELESSEEIEKFIEQPDPSETSEDKERLEEEAIFQVELKKIKELEDQIVSVLQHYNPKISPEAMHWVQKEARNLHLDLQEEIQDRIDYIASIMLTLNKKNGWDVSETYPFAKAANLTDSQKTEETKGEEDGNVE
ncbi:MAG: hypothetical protein DWQ19_12380 [Crenarchaeota archaeon]|nr:MAG: hypothetical protein DWQ19_12380 [Thermoproteota archaeon]